MLLLMLSRHLRALAARMSRQAGPGGSEDPVTGTAHRATLAGSGRTAASAGRPAGFLAGFRDGPPADPVRVPLAVRTVQLIVLAVVLVTVPLSTPGFGQNGQGIAVAVTLAISAVSWAAWIFASERPWLWLALLAVMGAAGATLAGLSAHSTAFAVGFVVTIAAGARLPGGLSIAIAVETVAAFVIASLASGATAQSTVGWSAVFAGLWAFGLTRRAYLLRAVEAEQGLEQAGRARAAETQAAALAERARIAREIHDILAQALAAVSVNLQAAEGLLGAVPDKGPELAKAVGCVERAGALTKEGMAEVRQAILALRDNCDGSVAAGAAAGEPWPSRGTDATGSSAASATSATSATSAGELAGRLIGRLRALADEHRAAGDAPVEFAVTGIVRPLEGKAALAVYRTAQESLTNARKHAPGQPVTVVAAFTPDDMTLLVSSPLPPAGTAGPLARFGTGHGLAGLRERAALADGTLTAGPQNDWWQVRLHLPDAAAGASPRHWQIAQDARNVRVAIAGQERRTARESAHDHVWRACDRRGR